MHFHVLSLFVAIALLEAAHAFLAPGRRVCFVASQQQQLKQPFYISSEAVSTEAASTEDASMEETSSSTDSETVVAASAEKQSAERHTIYIGNLPYDTQESALKDLFGQYGTVESVNMPRNRDTGLPRGFAFLDMSTAEEMNKAIQKTHETDFGGRSLRVSQSLPKDQIAPRKERPATPRRSAADGYKKIYVGNIPFECTEEDLREFFVTYGEVKEVYIPTDPGTGNVRGFAFLTMKEEDANKAIEATNGQEFAGRKLTVSEPLPPGKKGPRSTKFTKMYVGNLSFYTVRETLEEIFQEFGTVHDCYMPEDPSTGGSRGFGFVTMDAEAAARAIAEIDGCEVDGRIIQVNEAQVKKSGRRNEYAGDD